jgi:hypothetical protein
MTTREIRPMSMGEVLDRSFQILRRHVGTLFVTAVLGTAPLLVLYLAMGTAGTPLLTDAEMAAMSGTLVLAFLLFLVTGTISWAALTREIDQGVEGAPVTLGDGLRTGLRSFFRVLAYAILVYVVGFVIVLPVSLALFAVATVAGGLLGSEILAGVLAVLGFGTGLLLAALVWAPMAFLGLPALISEGIGPIAAIKRGHELGKGGRVRIVATAVVAWLVMMLPTVGLPFLFGFGMSLWSPETAGTVAATQLYLYQAVTFLVGGLTTPFLVAVMVYTYYDRRVRREGYDVELASAAIPQGV